MGALQTKSPLERRNTIVRRSQRRSLHNLKPKIGQIQKKIRKFKDIESTTENYDQIVKEIEHLKCEMSKIGKELQPQIRNLYENIYKGVREIEEALDKKLEQNREKWKSDDNRTTIQSGDGSNINSNDDKNDGLEGIEIEEVQNEAKKAGGGDAGDQLESGLTHLATNDVKSVEFIAAKLETGSKSEFQLRSPEDKRKSILKVGGVPVMPGAMLDQLEATIHTNNMNITAAQNVTNTTNNTNNNGMDPITIINFQKINSINKLLNEIEEDISRFKGKKYGKQYAHIQNLLNKLMGDLSGIRSTNDYVNEQLKISQNYIGSCLNFLDERAELEISVKKTESVGSSDDVFLSSNGNNKSTIIQRDNSFNNLLAMKTTAV